MATTRRRRRPLLVSAVTGLGSPLPWFGLECWPRLTAPHLLSATAESGGVHAAAADQSRAGSQSREPSTSQEQTNRPASRYALPVGKRDALLKGAKREAGGMGGMNHPNAGTR